MLAVILFSSWDFLGLVRRVSTRFSSALVSSRRRIIAVMQQVERTFPVRKRVDLVYMRTC